MSSRARLVCAGIGLAQGVVFWLAYAYWPQDPAGRGLWMAAVFLTAAAGLTAHFAWSGRDHARLAAVALALGVPFACVAYWVFAQIPVDDAPYYGDDLRAGTWSQTASMCLYVLLPFAQIFQRTGTLRFPYRDLFFHAWTNAFVGAMGLVYAGVFLLLLLLWGRLFALIGIDFFAEIFDSPLWNYLSLPAVFAYGLAMGRENTRFPDAGRAAALAVFRFLLPLLAGILLLFLASLTVTGLQPLWATRRATALLLTLAGFVVLFLNAVFEDGEREPPYALPVRRGVEAAVLALPAIAALAAYAIWLRIAPYGLTPDRVLASVSCAVTAAFALAYATAVLWPSDRWLGALRPANVVLSLGVVALGFALHTPLLDPLRLSARSQVERLLAGRVDAASFDFAALRFHLGHAGHEALARLEAAKEHPEHAKIVAAIETARGLRAYEVQAAPPRRLGAENLLALAPLTAVPEGLAAFLDETSDTSGRDWCFESPCTLFALDLDGDGAPEHCLVAAKEGTERWNPTRCFARDAAGWRKLGALLGESGSIDVRELRTHGAEPTPSRYRAVRVGEHVFHLATEPHPASE
jgi:hypothetical protein